MKINHVFEVIAFSNIPKDKSIKEKYTFLATVLNVESYNR